MDAEASGGGVTLRFITRNNWFIGRVSVSSVHSPPAEGVLENAARLELGTLYTPEGGAQAGTNITDVLRNNGFYVTKVEPRLEYDPATQQVHISFVAGTGDRATYAPPTVTGSLERPAESIVKATHWKGWFGWKDVTEARTQDGVQRVRRSYQKQDRLQARVTLEKMEYDAATDRVKPALNVDGGPKVDVSVTGAKISKGKLRQIVPVYEEHSVDRDLLVEGSNNLMEYLEGGRLLRRPGRFSIEESGGGRAGDRIHDRAGPAPPGHAHRDRRATGTFPLRPFASACTCARHRGCNSGMGGIARRCCGATWARSPTCTAPTASGMSTSPRGWSMATAAKRPI